jgi:hypothetical protein
MRSKSCIGQESFLEDPMHIEMKNLIQLGYTAVYILNNQK